MIVGAIGSLVLMFLHGRPSVFLLILFTGWVLAPFIGLAWADKLAARWPSGARIAVYYLMLVVSVGSLGVYGYDVATGYGRAVWFVLVPGVAWLLILLVLPFAVLAGRRSTPRV
ncbi:MAG TPA: hypothetical protein VKD28_01630 [Gemmatimonadales bacterium]|nr:hypothetical protein [Gemmatimonadales bacterium]